MEASIKTARFTLLAALITTAAFNTLADAPSYAIERIGLTGDGYTKLDGSAYSEVSALNVAGQAVGYSRRYKATNNYYYGRSTWLYNGSSTVNIGLTGNGYTKLNGYRYREVAALNDAGQAVGYSRRYNAANNDYYGRAAWLYNGSNTVQIGLRGNGYTKSNGYAYSAVSYLNDAGQAAGYSNRYNAAKNDYYGQSAWLYNGSSTVQIGLTGDDYTDSYGVSESNVFALNEAGQVVGHSTRYGAESFGQVAWLYNGSTTVQIGLTDGNHTSNGWTYSQVKSLNDAGQAAGESYRFYGVWDEIEAIRYLGRMSAWIYNGSSTVPIGLIGDGYTDSYGFEGSEVKSLNDAGQVVGYSRCYAPETHKFRGRATWLYDGSSTVQIGLTGDGYTKLDGYRLSYVTALNDSGQAVGYSNRYNSANNIDYGRSAWLYNGTSTVRIGLRGNGYTKLNGYAYSEVSFLNDSGQAAGYSRRYKAANNQYYGQSAWFYDMALNQTVNLTPDSDTSGDAYSKVTFLGEDGLVLGYYRAYENGYMDYRAFYYKSGEGLFDLGTLVDGLDDSGWARLATAIRGNAVGHIVGTGTLTGQSNVKAAYILKPQ